jgi:hypothetical protein
MFRLLEWFFYRVLHAHHYSDKPCTHMKNRLSDMSDGSAKGFTRWYTERHISGCPGCSGTLSGLRALRARLLRIGSPSSPVPEAEDKLALSPDRWQAVTEAWEESDKTAARGAAE